MLDENLPTFIFRPMPDTPHSSVVYFTRSGSDPAPEYVLRIADPATKPACRGVYGAALTDPYNSNDVVYSEVAVKPEWQQPTLSTAELRAQEAAAAGNGSSADTAAPIPKLPESFHIQLYNPDQIIQVKWNAKSWNKTESWEFDVPIQSFKPPSTSRLDRQEESEQQQHLSFASGPRNTFKWKRDGRLGNKDMTCYMVGRTEGLQRSKEPDITVALFKHGRDPSVTIYEPNLQRVDVQDRKGLDLVLLLGAQVIRDLYLMPKADPFNLEGAAADGGRRRTSRAAATVSTAAATAAVGGISSSAASTSRPPPPKAAPVTTTVMHNGTSSSSSRPTASTSSSSVTPSAAAIDAETKRLQSMLEREERERQRREREEEKRIKKMLDAEDKERRRREAEVAKETERLRKKYGIEGQDLPSASSSSASAHRPVPPTPSSSSSHRPSHGGGYYMTPASGLPQRPSSAGPRPNQQSSSSSSHHHSGHSSNHWWQNSSSGNSSSTSHKQKRIGSGPYLNGPVAAASGLFSSSRDVPDSERKKIQKKRSVYF